MRAEYQTSRLNQIWDRCMIALLFGVLFLAWQLDAAQADPWLSIGLILGYTAVCGKLAMIYQQRIFVQEEVTRLLRSVR